MRQAPQRADTVADFAPGGQPARRPGRPGPPSRPGGVVGEDSHHRGATFDFLAYPLERVGAAELSRKRHKGQHVVPPRHPSRGSASGLAPQPIGGLSPLPLRILLVVLNEPRPDHRGLHLVLPSCTCPSALRLGWTRHRCQVACSSLAVAVLSPSWASDTIRRAPASPRPSRARRNCSRNASVSAGPHAVPSTSRRPSAFTPTATTSVRLITCPSSRDFGYVAFSHRCGHCPTSGGYRSRPTWRAAQLVPLSHPRGRGNLRGLQLIAVAVYRLVPLIYCEYIGVFCEFYVDMIRNFFLS